jgi:non-lysosomal glucosylceramidase
MKDAAFETTCTDLFNRGSKWTDANLFNGEYYIQKVEPVANKNAIAPGLLIGMGAKDLSHPDFQIGEGCLVDQLVGQNMALICGLGYLADSTHIKKALQSIVKYNYVHSFEDHFNNMRSYALGNESGLILTAYPEPSKRPVVPLSYAFEAWTGLEYTAATGMIYEGMRGDALHTIIDVRNRFDGIKRNPFNEEECGNHYARAMASWSVIIAISRFNYSAVTGKFTITGVPGNYFWSDGYAWGNAEVRSDKVILTVHSGTLKLTSVGVQNGDIVYFKHPEILKEGDRRVVVLGKEKQ